MKLSQKKNLMLLGINFKDKELQAKTFLGELGNPYDLLAKDKNGKNSVKFGIYGCSSVNSLTGSTFEIKIGASSFNPFTKKWDY